MALVYYSRMRMVMQLLPLLEASDLPAHVVSIYAGGLEGDLARGQSPLGTPDPAVYSFNLVRKHTTYMKTLFFERLAEQHPGRLSLSHVFPGLVITPVYKSSDSPLWFKIVWRIIAPFMKAFIALPHDESGLRMLYLATPRYAAKGGKDAAAAKLGPGIEVARSTTGEVGGGAYSLNWDGKEQDVAKRYETIRKEGMGDKVWEHTMGVFEHINQENAKRT